MGDLGGATRQELNGAFEDLQGLHKGVYGLGQQGF